MGKTFKSEAAKLGFDSVKDFLKSVFKDCKSYQEASEKTGFSKKSIANKASHYGIIALKAQTMEAVTIRNGFNSPEAYLKSLFAECNTLKEAAYKSGLSDETLSRWVKRFGIKTQHQKEREAAISKTKMKNTKWEKKVFEFNIIHRASFRNKFELVSALAEVYTAKDLAENLSASTNTVNSILRQIGKAAQSKTKKGNAIFHKTAPEKWLSRRRKPCEECNFRLMSKTEFPDCMECTLPGDYADLQRAKDSGFSTRHDSFDRFPVQHHERGGFRIVYGQ